MPTVREANGVDDMWTRFRFDRKDQISTVGREEIARSIRKLECAETAPLASTSDMLAA